MKPGYDCKIHDLIGSVSNDGTLAHAVRVFKAASHRLLMEKSSVKTRPHTRATSSVMFWVVLSVVALLGWFVGALLFNRMASGSWSSVSGLFADPFWFLTGALLLGGWAVGCVDAAVALFRLICRRKRPLVLELVALAVGAALGAAPGDMITVNYGQLWEGWSFLTFVSIWVLCAAVVIAYRVKRNRASEL